MRGGRAILLNRPTPQAVDLLKLNTSICRVKMERGHYVTYLCKEGVPNPQKWPKTEIRCSTRDGTEAKVLWENPDSGKQYMSRSLRYGDVVPMGCTGIIDTYESEDCPICSEIMFDKTTTHVETFYCEEQQSHVAHSKCAASYFRRKAAPRGLHMDNDKDVLTLIAPAYECVLCKKTEVGTRVRRSQERKEPYPELLSVLQHSPSESPETVTLRELWRHAAKLSETQQTEGASIFLVCAADMKDKWNKTNAEGQTYLTEFNNRIFHLRHSQVTKFIYQPNQRNRFFGPFADHQCDNLTPEQLVKKVRTLVPITRVYAKEFGFPCTKGDILGIRARRA